MTPIRVLLADDHAVMREGLASLIAKQDDMEVVGQASDGAQAIKLCTATTPDVLIVDLTMPRCGGMEVLQQVSRSSPKTRILILTMHDHPHYLRSAIAAGAAGYVVKELAAQDVLEAVRSVHAGQAFIRVSLSKEALNEAIGSTSQKLRGVPPVTLSDRERQVLRLIAYGYTNQETAAALGVGKKSVDSYRARLQQKLGLSRRSELVRYALDMRILSPESNPDAGDG